MIILIVILILVGWFIAYIWLLKSYSRKEALLLFSIIVIASIGYINWYRNNHYSSTFTTKIMMQCENSGHEATLCQCTLNQLEANYSYKQAKHYEDTNTYPDNLAIQVQERCA